LRQRFLSALESLGGSAGNGKLQAELGWQDDTYWSVHAELIEDETVVKGRGRGGSVSLAASWDDSVQPDAVAVPAASPPQGQKASPVPPPTRNSGRNGGSTFEQTFKNIDDVLWKEAGCTTELNYTEQTSWILFLKYLDDMEQSRAMEAELVGKPYARIIDEAHGWSRWAAPKKADGSFDHDNALSGDDLIDYVNRQLFPYLQGFRQRATGPDTIEYKIGEIFSEIKNRFQSGYSLRDALELVDELRLRSQKEKHELSHLHEAKIRNMGNAGRNGGEYYTPRPLIRAMIQVIRPKIGERIYDGALGSAGFLCEAYPPGRADHQPASDAADAHFLRQGEEEPRLCHRHDEHDPARHRGAEHRAYKHAD
jgi:hypothetical protein